MCSSSAWQSVRASQIFAFLENKAWLQKKKKKIPWINLHIFKLNHACCSSRATGGKKQIMINNMWLLSTQRSSTIGSCARSCPTPRRWRSTKNWGRSMRPTAWTRASTRSASTLSSWKKSATVRHSHSLHPTACCVIAGKAADSCLTSQSRRGRIHRWWSCRPWGVCSRPTSTSSPSWRTFSRPCFVTAMRSVLLSAPSALETISCVFVVYVLAGGEFVFFFLLQYFRQLLRGAESPARSSRMSRWVLYQIKVGAVYMDELIFTCWSPTFDNVEEINREHWFVAQ